MNSESDFFRILKDSAISEGFPLVGAVDLDLAFSDPSRRLQEHIEYYDDWIRSGYSGDMTYLVRGTERRHDPRNLFPEAKSILCVAIPYPRGSAGAPSPSDGPRYARYLQGNDYHISIAEKLERVMQTTKDAIASQANETETLKWKVCVDTSAILERTWASLAGLGWIGKNTHLIHPKLGSYLFLGEVLINRKTGQAPSPLPDYCGHCSKCLEACPTKAFPKPHVLDSNQCVSYWTLEKRGEITLSQETKNSIGTWIAGCDICQEVCPFNIKPTREEAQKENLPTHLNSKITNATQTHSWKALLEETPEEYKLRVKNSAMKRIKPGQFSRNLALSLKNSIHVLSDSDRREITHSLEPLVKERLLQETDPSAQNEWRDCLELFQQTRQYRDNSQ